MLAILKTHKRIYLRIGFIVGFLLVSGLLFASLAEDVINHETISRLDPVLGNWLLSRTSLTGDHIFSMITFLGNALVISTCTALIGLWLAKEKSWNQVILLFVTVGGAALLNLTLKNIFLRPRPDFSLAFLHDTGFSFPSGHTMNATAFYGIIAFLIFVHFRDLKIRTFVIIGWILLSVLIGFSRLYLGVHYFSDVAAGWVAGVLWLTICIFGEYLFRLSKYIRSN